MIYTVLSPRSSLKVWLAECLATTVTDPLSCDELAFFGNRYTQANMKYHKDRGYLCSPQHVILSEPSRTPTNLWLLIRCGKDRLGSRFACAFVQSLFARFMH